MKKTKEIKKEIKLATPKYKLGDIVIIRKPKVNYVAYEQVEIFDAQNLDSTDNGKRYWNYGVKVTKGFYAQDKWNFEILVWNVFEDEILSKI